MRMRIAIAYFLLSCFLFHSAQRLYWCVRLSRLLVGFRRMHFKSLHFHFISLTEASVQWRAAVDTGSSYHKTFLIVRPTW